MTLHSLTTGNNRAASTETGDVTAVQLKGWRFPLSRYHLWDRSAIGDSITLTPAVIHHTLQSISRCAVVLSRDRDLAEGVGRDR